MDIEGNKVILGYKVILASDISFAAFLDKERLLFFVKRKETVGTEDNKKSEGLRV